MYNREFFVMVGEDTLFTLIGSIFCDVLFAGFTKKGSRNINGKKR